MLLILSSYFIFPHLLPLKPWFNYTTFIVAQHQLRNEICKGDAVIPFYFIFPWHAKLQIRLRKTRQSYYGSYTITRAIGAV